MQRYTYISENPFIGMKFHTEVDCASEYGEVFIEERNGNGTPHTSSTVKSWTKRPACTTTEQDI
jgi:hypothetical protein